MGETETDLTPILDRQRPEKPQQPTLKPPQPCRRAKSLLELLGPSQTRHARSRLAIQSPFDQRHQPSDASNMQPPLKKPRLSYPLASAVSQQPLAPPRPHAASTPLPSLHVEQVLDISSDDDAPERPNRTVTPLTLAGHSVPPAATNLQREASLPKSNKVKKTKPGNSGSVPSRQRQPAPKLKGLSPSSRPTTSRFSPVQSPPCKHGRLLLSGPRPKPKLLCLLPFPRNPESHRVCLSDANSIDEPTRILNPPIELSSSPTTPDPSSQPSTPRVLTPRSNVSTRNEHPPWFEDEQACLEDNPLFLPDNDQPSKSPSQRPILTQEEFGMMGTCGAPSSQFRHAGSPFQTPPVEHGPLESAHAGNDMLLIAGFQISQSPSLAFDSIVEVGEFVGDAMTVESSSPESVGRSLPSGSAQASPAVAAFATRSVSQRTPLQPLPNPASRPSSSRRASPLKLRRHVSDTAELTEKRAETERGPVEKGPNYQRGPWSAEEAFLLFDWWPPSLDKPAFWTDLAPVQSRSMAVPLPVFSTRITTARQLFNDDMNM